MRKALGIPSPPQPTPQALPPPQPNAPAATKPIAAVAAAHPPKPNAAVAAAHPPKPNAAVAAAHPPKPDAAVAATHPPKPDAAVAAAHPPKPDAAVAATHPPKPDAAIAAAHPPKPDAAVAATHPPMPNAAVAAAHPPMPKAAVAAAHPPNPDAGASNPPEADASMPPPPVPVPKAAPSPSQLNAVVDGAAAETANRALPNSVTNRAEYMQYLRAARNPSKMVKSLIPAFQGNKLDLFRIWLEKGQDFQQVAIEVRRRNAQKQTAAAKDKCMSRKDLEACGRYTESDIQELIARKTAEGLYINDPNFPNREDLRQYRVNMEVSHEIAHSREDSQEMVSNTSLNPTEALALTEEGADFSTTAMPSMNEVLQVGGNSGGSGGGIHGDTAEAPAGNAKAKAKTKAKAKAKPGDNTSDPPPDKPQTPLDKAMALKKIVLKEAEEARTLCISIEGLECATELQTALTTHSSAMTNLYRDLHQLTSQEVNDLSKYQAHLLSGSELMILEASWPMRLEGMTFPATGSGNRFLPTKELRVKANKAITQVELPILARLSEDVFIAPQGGLHSRGDKIMNLLGTGCKHRSLMLWGVADFLWVTDRPPLRLGQSLQKRAYESGMASLTAYASLSSMNLEKGRVNYKVRPKWHAWCHMVFEFATSDENCRNHKTLAEEDMLGKITKIASATHGATVAKRFFQRFSLFLGMHWEKLCNLQDMEIQEIW
ncbi:unnamed protein product [Cladocopium goreaui]|uniref:Myosin light chain kinase, smooth muscle (MLCK) (SmMLCK) (Telokin) [Cleaved into: Myosin light chai n kinase, smooth muscle, deglutamylated form] n=1 Tax=Cladocopium goreaui TaxID=2562237 RepID=A0A9P1FIQ8_9DINO|nr:unnamed protein product [Cladocopium goreaui]